MITARQVIPLRPRRPTLVFFTARQLLEAPVQFFGVLTRYSTYGFLVIMTVKCYFLPSSVSPGGATEARRTL